LEKIRYVDHAVYGVIADSSTGSIDEPLRRLSKAANYSRLWLAISSVVYVFGDRKARRAVVSGVAAVAVTSLLVNVVVKSLLGRTRPDRDAHDVPDDRKVPMPDSTSFPSGHSASGFAFATAVGVHLPRLAVPLRVLAGAVAYSRVHSGVHYPADALVGSMIGIAIGHIAARVGGSRADA
jgi:undecaprenyl-diphosphatase